MSSGPVVQALTNLNTAGAEATDVIDERKILNHVAGVDESAGLRVSSSGEPMIDAPEAEALEEAQLAIEAAQASDAEAQIQADERLTQAWTALKQANSRYNKQLEKEHKEEFQELDDSIRVFALSAMDESSADVAGTTVEDALDRGMTMKQLRELA